MSSMRHLAKFERGWAKAAFGTIFPGSNDATPMLHAEQMEIDGFLREVCGRVPLQAALGLRIAIWIVALAPLVVLRKFATIRGLDVADRERVITKLLASPSYAVRQLVMILKTIGALVYAAHPSVRVRMHVAPPNARPLAASADAGQLVALRLNRTAAA